MAHDVFISYSSSDQPAALAVLHGLESAGIRCWMAPRDIPPGAIWAQAIMEGISGSRALVVVFSAHANRSSHVLTEVDAAVRKGAVIVPFRIEDVMPDGALEYHLRARHWLDALTPDLKDHVARLAEQLRALLASGRPAEPATNPPRPMPDGLPRRRGRWTLRRALPLLGGTTLALALGVWWLGRPEPAVRNTFTVREVSAGGSNETTFRVRAEALRFFEGPSANATVIQRQYRDVFATDVTRYIKVELELGFDPPGRVVQFPFACVLERGEEQVVATLALTATVQPTWSQSYHAAGWGRASGGSWEPGRYRVECRYGKELVARDWFTVVAGGHQPPADAPIARATPLTGLRAVVKAIRLFESGFDLPDRGERLYATTFPGAGSRYIHVESKLGYSAPPPPKSAQPTCRHLRHRPEEVGRVTLTFDIAAGETGRYSARGWGNRQAGTWSPGEYLVACDDGEITLAQAGFTIT